MFEKMQPPHLAPWDKQVDKDSFFNQSIIFNESIKSDLNDVISLQSTKKLRETREFLGKSPRAPKTPRRNSLFAVGKTGATTYDGSAGETKESLKYPVDEKDRQMCGNACCSVSEQSSCNIF